MGKRPIRNDCNPDCSCVRALHRDIVLDQQVSVISAASCGLIVT